MRPVGGASWHTCCCGSDTLPDLTCGHRAVVLHVPRLAARQDQALGALQRHRHMLALLLLVAGGALQVAHQRLLHLRVKRLQLMQRAGAPVASVGRLAVGLLDQRRCSAARAQSTEARIRVQRVVGGRLASMRPLSAPTCSAATLQASMHAILG